MKRVFTSPDGAELGLLKDMLQKAGVPCAVRNEQLAQAIPSAPFHAELWVENDEDYPAAVALFESWRHPAFANREPWTCSRCGEKLEGQFSKCWKCGTEKEGVA